MMEENICRICLRDIAEVDIHGKFQDKYNLASIIQQLSCEEVKTVFYYCYQYTMYLVMDIL